MHVMTATGNDPDLRTGILRGHSFGHGGVSGIVAPGDEKRRHAQGWPVLPCRGPCARAHALQRHRELTGILPHAPLMEFLPSSRIAAKRIEERLGIPFFKKCLHAAFLHQSHPCRVRLLPGKAIGVRLNSRRSGFEYKPVDAIGGRHRHAQRHAPSHRIPDQPAPIDPAFVEQFEQRVKDFPGRAGPFDTRRAMTGQVHAEA